MVRRFGIDPVMGDLSDRDTLTKEARLADVVVNAADSDHRGAVEALVSALPGSGKALVHTSDSSIVADDARREASTSFSTRTRRSSLSRIRPRGSP